MAVVALSGRQLVWKINHEWWFYNPNDANSLVTDASLRKGVLNYTWAGFSECHESNFCFTRATDHGDGHISVFAVIAFQRLDGSGFHAGDEERLVAQFFDRRHFPDLPLGPRRPPRPLNT